MNKPKSHHGHYTDEEWESLVGDLDEEELEIMDAFERGGMVPSKDAAEAIAMARTAARNTLTEPREMNIRVRELYARLVEQRAEKRGVTCDDVFATALEEYLIRLLSPQP